jgi:hypothetical protein
VTSPTGQPPPRLRSIAAAVLLLLASWGISCMEPPDHAAELDATGKVALALVLSPGVVLNSVGYLITGSGVIPYSGRINVSDPGAGISLFIGEIPVGRDYVIELSATSTDGGTTCAGRATFDVAPAATSAVQLTLQCTGPATTGPVIVTGTVNSCPVIGVFSASPITMALGGAIDLQATATDTDPATTLEYFWTTTGNGTFTSSRTPSTQFTCSLAGTPTLRLTVTDGECPTFTELQVSCVDAPAGM